MQKTDQNNGINIHSSTIRVLFKKLTSSSFLKSSSLVFLVNLGIGVLNYVLVIFASRLLPNDYGLWTAMSGLMAILITPMSGIMTEYTKNISKLSKLSIKDSQQYYLFVQQKLVWFIYVSIFVSFLSILIYTINPSLERIVIILGLVVYMLLNVNTNVRQQYLLGSLHIVQYAISIVITNVSRFIPTLILLYFGFGVLSLPIGLIISCIVGIYIGGVYIEKLHSIDLIATKKHTFNLIKDFIASSKNMLSLFFVLSFFNIAPIITEQTLQGEKQDLFAVLFNFGQIIHFGAIAFMGVLVAFASRGKNLKVYLISISIVSGLALFIGGLFSVFGEVLLQLFDRSQYIDAIPLIVLYSVFIALYNIIFVSVQYLISHSEYKKVFILPLFLTLLVIMGFATTSNSLTIPLLGQIEYQKVSLFGGEVVSFISGSIIIGLLAAMYFGYVTVKYHISTPSNIEKSTH